MHVTNVAFVTYAMVATHGAPARRSRECPATVSYLNPNPGGRRCGARGPAGVERKRGGVQSAPAVGVVWRGGKHGRCSAYSAVHHRNLRHTPYVRSL